MGLARAVLSETRPPEHSSYSQPREVVASPALRAEQKRLILLDWLQDELALLVAEDEGMFGGTAPRVDKVQQALRELAR